MTAIQRSKSNLFARLLVFVFLMLITVILTSESVFLFGLGERAQRIGGFIYSVFVTGFVIYTIPIMTSLGYSSKVTRLIKLSAIAFFIGALYVSNPLLNIVSEKIQPFMFSFFHLCLLVGQILFSKVILKDIFGNQQTQTDHIWGAIVVYYLIIMMFSEVMEIITLIKPGLLGEVYVMGFPNYIQVIMFSVNCITGMDTLYANAHPLLLKIGNLENMIGNLFLVVILGRLLSHPIGKGSI